MNILILGSGGRESAFAWKVAQSAHCDKLFIAPGNAGTTQYGTNVNIKVTDFEGIKALVLKEDINLVLVGPEEPLVKGVHDFFLADEQLKNIPVVGPQQEGAQLEGSKDFSKQFMERHNIPTAAYRTFTKDTLQDGLTYLATAGLPVVLKADGLAAGKGVLICLSLEEAQTELTAMLADAKFGEASSRVVVEQFLTGIELSVFVMTDGNSYKILPEAKDYKRIGEGDTGLNTGGMGSISPVPFADAAYMKKVEERVIIPTIEGLKKDGILYKGFIFIGLMNSNGEPWVIEYNCRMGDPETESVMRRIDSDFVDLLLGVAEGNLNEKEIIISPKTAATVVMVAGGYPGEYLKNKVITGTENVRDSIVFHAGTSMDGNDVITTGGRVLAITTVQDDMFSALQQATADASRIYYDGMYFRKDIGFDLL
ncbi:phosphoribosylamine--glycine ligase [Mucilaginibacter rubeus]|uniref:Phosphoribosylamine--glycine ligase n=1 Tax=Mucilaginibacter rubeus TaxID=2027860 RepID=A0AAE6JM64_9SPHI|nr:MULTISPECIES: phosphoribosylamine--glycine ligase [Mucilaginibacter]QEM08063.1 phosphoribosylamine--glycine ligase [Mucilaginibacter rubeus]QEM20515.1 phosphoribosylamine--glycine ligase [Mucilaginibacter gossypii]QTE42760.1 phosphoribosylamine--glycine ligase [Mucilaginibacter rubeus]QTE49361.1 phosphoribosylamine--glycine ligase [Mucilaginibacter rubeus]QTE54457.1 phosphoribosylamine--glycine ligase [Mucilaginibacter rubeus]